jgi:hypothetical protein
VNHPVLDRAAGSQFPPLDVRTVAKVMRDARAIDPRLCGKPRSIRIGFHPPIDWVDIAAKAIIVAGLGLSVAMWVAL